LVHLKTFPGQQDAQATTFIYQLAQPLALGIIAMIQLLILKDLPIQPGRFTRPTLGQAVPIHLIAHRSSRHIRRQ
jgi:hypothetical protein